MSVLVTGIPMPPSLNHAYPSDRFGRRFKSKEFRNWEYEFEQWALVNNRQVVNARMYCSKVPNGHYLYVHTQFSWEYKSIITLKGKPKRNDTSNRIKIAHDAIAGALWIDDSYFFDGSFTKRLTPKGVAEHCNIELRWVEAPWMLEGLT